jgi:hypothetical protein
LTRLASPKRPLAKIDENFVSTTTRRPLFAGSRTINVRPEDHSPVVVSFVFTPPDLKGTINMVLRESIYGEPDRVTTLLNYDIKYPDPDIPNDLPVQQGFSARLLNGLFPGYGVYRWTFESKVTTASGQVAKDTKTFEIESIYIPLRDVPGFTPWSLDQSLLPGSLCVDVF